MFVLYVCVHSVFPFPVKSLKVTILPEDLIIINYTSKLVQWPGSQKSHILRCCMLGLKHIFFECTIQSHKSYSVLKKSQKLSSELQRLFIKHLSSSHLACSHLGPASVECSHSSQNEWIFSNGHILLQAPGFGVRISGATWNIWEICRDHSDYVTAT